MTGALLGYPLRGGETNHPNRLKPGSRVRHSGQMWFEASEHGTATVIESVEQPDGTCEYLVQKDQKMFPDSPPVHLFSWWASYHTRAALGPQ